MNFIEWYNCNLDYASMVNGIITADDYPVFWHIKQVLADYDHLMCYPIMELAGIKKCFKFEFQLGRQNTKEILEHIKDNKIWVYRIYPEVGTDNLIVHAVPEDQF